MLSVEQDKRIEQISSKERWLRQPAPEVVRAIVEANPKISEVMLAQYCSWFDSDSGERIEYYDFFKDISRDAVLASFLYFEIASFAHLVENDEEPRDALSVGSKVKLFSGEIAHIPMMDFKIYSSPKNLSELESVLKMTKFPSGFLLKSGRSFHYYGVELMPQEVWLEWMESMLSDEAPIYRKIDSSWVEKSIARECSFLRLAPSPSKSFLPRVIALV